MIVLVARQPNRGASQPVVEVTRGPIQVLVGWVFAGGIAIAGGARDAVVIAGCLVIGGGIVKAGAGGNPLRPGGKILLIADV